MEKARRGGGAGVGDGGGDGGKEEEEERLENMHCKMPFNCVCIYEVCMMVRRKEEKGR
jgi:hypothetical protein